MIIYSYLEGKHQVDRGEAELVGSMFPLAETPPEVDGPLPGVVENIQHPQLAGVAKDMQPPGAVEDRQHPPELVENHRPRFFHGE